MAAAVLSLDAQTKRLIEDSLNRFVDQAYDPAARHARLSKPSVDYRACWATLAELGVLSLAVSEARGGIGGSALDVSDALRVLARGLLLEPLIESALVAGAVLRRGTDDGLALAEAMSGEVMTILVGGRRDDALHCHRNGDAWQLSGVARVVPGAAQADVWLIACVDEARNDRVLRVRRSDCAARLENYRMMDGREASDVHFESAEISARESTWLEGQAAHDALEDAAAQAVSAYSADAAGVMQCLVTWTGEYLRTREQFGVKLGTFQALQHRYADMHIAALEARALSRETARAIDRAEVAGSASTENGAAALQRLRWLRFATPAVIARCGTRVGHDAIQLHGGMGVTDELIISHGNSRLVVLGRLLERWATDPAAVEQAASDAGETDV